MTNHGSRGHAPSAPNPAPAAIRAARESAGLTQTAAGRLIHCSCRTWQQWENGDRRMHPAFWELWQFKTDGYVKITAGGPVLTFIVADQHRAP